MTKPTVLFACIHNSGRSVAAKALTRHYAGDRIDVRSAGSEDWQVDDPAGQELETVRRIVDDIDDRVRHLEEELVTST